LTAQFARLKVEIVCNHGFLVDTFCCINDAALMLYLVVTYIDYVFIYGYQDLHEWQVLDPYRLQFCSSARHQKM